MKRYDEPDGDHRGMKRDDEWGYWVSYDDHVAELSSANKVKDEALATIEKVREWMFDGYGTGCSCGGKDECHWCYEGIYELNDILNGKEGGDGTT